MENATFKPLSYPNITASKDACLDNLSIFLYRYIDGYAKLATACFGFAFNTIGMYLLLRRKGHKLMFNLLLAINLMFDTTYLLFEIFITLFLQPGIKI